MLIPVYFGSDAESYRSYQAKRAQSPPELFGFGWRQQLPKPVENPETLSVGKPYVFPTGSSWGKGVKMDAFTAVFKPEHWNRLTESLVIGMASPVLSYGFQGPVGRWGDPRCCAA